MPKYRPIHTKIWNDKDFRKLNPNAKLIFLYLITTEKTVNSGIWEEPLEEVAYKTGIPLPKVKELLSNGSIKNITYDFENEMVFVHNFKKYNPGGNPALVEKGIISEYMVNSKTPLWNLFVSLSPCFKGILPTVEQPLSKGSLPLPLPLEDLTKSMNLSEFEIRWKRYKGEKDGKKLAIGYWNSSVKTPEDLLDYDKAEQNYYAIVEASFEGRRLKSGKVWFNNWRDYIDQKPPEKKVVDYEKRLKEMGAK